MLDLTGTVSACLAHVLGPPPTRFVGSASDRGWADSVELELPLFKSPDLGWVLGTHELQVHGSAIISVVLPKRQSLPDLAAGIAITTTADSYVGSPHCPSP